jgi:hypothetical protein
MAGGSGFAGGGVVVGGVAGAGLGGGVGVGVGLAGVERGRVAGAAGAAVGAAAPLGRAETGLAIAGCVAATRFLGATTTRSSGTVLVWMTVRRTSGGAAIRTDCSPR